jgi:four helix bundle protein
MRDHQKLRTFHLADKLVVSVYQATHSFPKVELFGLTSQVRRAAVSIAANIVEGCARATHAEYLRFLDIAHGSARELEYEVSLCLRLGYIDKQSGSRLIAQCAQVSKSLNALIRALQRG